MKIVILDGYSANPGDLSWGGLEALGEVTVYDRTPESLVVERAADAEIVITNKVCLSAQIMQQLPKLRMISVLATGYNIIDTEAARNHGIVVCNVPAYSTDSVAQMVIAHILNVTNHVNEFARDNRGGRWSRSKDFCYWDDSLHELAGKSIGIVGLGNIGKRVARIALAMGMKVVAFTSKEQSQLPDRVRKATLAELLSECDFVTLHCPLTADTRGMINSQSLATMKPGAMLINTGRGPLVVEDDVAQALHSGHLGAYAADVMCQEPPATDSALLAEPHAYITPHVAWATFEARTRLLEATTENVRRYIAGEPQNVVNK